MQRSSCNGEHNLAERVVGASAGATQFRPGPPLVYHVYVYMLPLATRPTMSPNFCLDVTLPVQLPHTIMATPLKTYLDRSLGVLKRNTTKGMYSVLPVSPRAKLTLQCCKWTLLPTLHLSHCLASTAGSLPSARSQTLLSAATRTLVAFLPQRSRPSRRHRATLAMPLAAHHPIPSTVPRQLGEVRTTSRSTVISRCTFLLRMLDVSGQDTPRSVTARVRRSLERIPGTSSCTRT